MKQPIFTGSGVAIVTPFNHESVDLKSLASLLDHQLENHTDAIIVCGTTGEASTMTYRERMRTIEFCVDHISGKIPVIAGSGSNSTEAAIALSKDAERAGADGLLVVTPYYNKANQTGLIRHYQVISDAVNCPVILYNVPSRTGVNIAPESYAELAKHPNIIGTKEASGNFSNLQKTRNLCQMMFTSGPETMTKRFQSARSAVSASSRWWLTSSPIGCTGWYNSACRTISKLQGSCNWS